MTLRDQLLELQEPKYMKFTAALMPGVENVLGIRLPVLRKIARQIAAGDWRTYLAEAEDFYFEERMLHFGMPISLISLSIPTALLYPFGINSRSILLWLIIE